MNICKKCGISFIPSKGLIQFCSLRCRNSRQFSEDTKQLKADKATLHFNSLPNEQKEAIKLRLAGLREKRQPVIERLFNSDFETLSWESKRSRIIVEQKFCCNKCGLDSWLDKPIVIEIDHIDGDNKNNSRSNLEGLCPNCHSQTPTWRGKHINNKSIKTERLLKLKASL